MATIDTTETATIPADIKVTLRMGLHDRTDRVREQLKNAFERNNHDDIAYWLLCREELVEAALWLDEQP